VRIGIISPYSLTLPGGVQGQVLALARVLRTKGPETRVLGPCDGPPPDAGVTPLGNSLPTAANGSVAPIAPDASAQFRLIRALREEDFDVVHLHEPLAPGTTMTALLVRSAPIVATFHAAGGSMAYRWLRPGVRALARRIDVRCAVSDDARVMAEAALGGSYRVLYNGIEIDRVQAVVPARTDAPTILFVGRHEPRKGLDVLLASLAHLPSDTQLWVAGEGPDTRALRAQYGADSRISWLGRITEDEKLARLRGADVFCAPSLRGESFGIVLLEAMAAGTAIVASDLPGYANVVRSGLDAVLVPPGDPGALAAALVGVLTSPARRAALVASGAARAERFSMDRLADAYLECYGEARAIRDAAANRSSAAGWMPRGVRVRRGIRR
jgi:phosphatidylinositol alpha-mannosyltransferase